MVIKVDDAKDIDEEVVVRTTGDALLVSSVLELLTVSVLLVTRDSLEEATERKAVNLGTPLVGDSLAELEDVGAEGEKEDSVATEEDELSAVAVVLSEEDVRGVDVVATLSVAASNMLQTEACAALLRGHRC